VRRLLAEQPIAKPKMMPRVFCIVIATSLHMSHKVIYILIQSICQLPIKSRRSIRGQSKPFATSGRTFMATHTQASD
jgi:hypothetical protein